jgi:hypothetical protein
MPKTAFGPQTALGPACAAVLAALMLLAGGISGCSDDSPQDDNYGTDVGARFDLTPLPTVDAALEAQVYDVSADQMMVDSGTDAGAPETPTETNAGLDAADAATGE